MNKFSDNYPHLEALLNGYSKKYSQTIYTYHDHTQMLSLVIHLNLNNYKDFGFLPIKSI